MIKNLLISFGVVAALVIAVAVGVKIGREDGKSASITDKTSDEMAHAWRKKALEKAVEVAMTKGLQDVADQINDTAPIMLDKYTRLDRAIVGPGLKLSYHYSLINYSADDIDSAFLKENLFPNIRNEVCTSEEMKPSLQNGVKYVYWYSSNDDRLIGLFGVNREDCGFSAISP